MTLMLDSRRKAMLKAAGIDLWWQTVQASAAPDSVPMPQAAAPHVRPEQAQPVARIQPVSSPSVASVAGSAPAPRAVPARAAPAPAPAVAAAPSWHAPADLPWGFSPAQQVFAALPQPAAGAAGAAAVQWLFVTDHFADLAEEAQAAERLFLNMLTAMGLAQSPHVWQTSMRKMGAPDAPVPYPVLERQALLAASSAQVIVAMGRVAAQVLLASSQPLGALRQAVTALPNAAVVATYSPSYLLRSPGAKAGAWADLRLALHVALSQGKAA